MRFKRKLLIAPLVGVMFIVFASNALAANAKVKTVKDGGNTDVIIVSATASSDVSFSFNYRNIGTWDAYSKSMIRKAHGRPACFWATGTWTNSVRTPVVKSYLETSTAKFCWLKHPVRVNGVTYTALKVAGGKTGSPCFNLAIPPGRRQPKPQIQGPVLDVKSSANVSITINVNASSLASVTGEKNCGGAILTGSASGSASINGKIRIQLSWSILLNSRGRVTGAVRAAIKQQVSLKVEAAAKNNASAKISITCSTPPVQICAIPGAINYGQPGQCIFPPGVKVLTCDSVSRNIGDHQVNITDVGYTAQGYTVAKVHVDWGNGSSDLPPGHPVMASRAYGDGTFQVVVTIVATDGTTATSAQCQFPVTFSTQSPPPTIENMTQIQEMYVNETRANVCVDTYIPAGEGSGTVIFSVQKGTAGAGWFSENQQSVSNGNGHVCATYHAPSEPGTNVLVAKLYVSGQDPVQTSETVQILPSPPPPGSSDNGSDL